ncbi:MAG: DeoR/GlpR family DNA-binding transcription regulator [Dorea longicatena]
MIAIERRNGILEKLQEDKKVVVGELSQLYKVSEETIRRDLERLEKEGLCTKSYGGAVLNENNNVEMPFNVRKKSNATGKQKIAELIAGMVEDGEHILLDASTTAVYIAKALKSREKSYSRYQFYRSSDRGIRYDGLECDFSWRKFKRRISRSHRSSNNRRSERI